MMNEMGKVIARQPGSVLSDNSNEAEAATRFELNRNAVHYQTSKPKPLLSLLDIRLI